jgi:hypothetical protein
MKLDVDGAVNRQGHRGAVAAVCRDRNGNAPLGYCTISLSVKVYNRVVMRTNISMEHCTENGTHYKISSILRHFTCVM